MGSLPAQVAEQPGNNRPVLEGRTTSWGNRQQPPGEGGSNCSHTYLYCFGEAEDYGTTQPEAALPVGVTVLEEHILHEDPRHGAGGWAAA